MILFSYMINEGMYKNRVGNDRKIFEIPALLSCERGNLAENRPGKFKIYTMYVNVILNFPTMVFLFNKKKEPEFQIFFCHFVYPIFIHTLGLTVPNTTKISPKFRWIFTSITKAYELPMFPDLIQSNGLPIPRWNISGSDLLTFRN